MSGGDAQGWKPKHSQRHGSCGKSAHASINVDTHYDVVEDVYVTGEFKRPHEYKYCISGIHEDDYTRPNDNLEMRPYIRSKEQLKYISRMFDGIGEFKDLKYHIELDPKFKPRVQTPHKVALSIVWTKERVRSDGKTRQN